MKSKLDTYSINEDESRSIISAYCRKNVWKYRKMEWDNDIDGEIEVFDETRETTAKFIKVQLKTIDDPSKFNGPASSFSYDAPIKFLNFCDVCDIPIILAVFNINQGIGYYIFVKKYIYEDLDVNTPNWRNNLTTIRIQIPKENSFDSRNSKTALTEIAFSGTKLIAQLRKIDTHKKYYTVIRQGDNSHAAALRTDITILVEKSFSSSKEAMRILIPKILEQYSQKVYYRNHLVSDQFKDKSNDVIYMFFYNSLEQSKFGIPFCRILWIDSNLPELGRPLVSSPHEIIGDINVYWEANEDLDNLISENLLDKGQYLPFIDGVFQNFDKLYSSVQQFSAEFNKGASNADKFIANLKSLSTSLDDLYESISDLGFPPNECNDLDIKINNLIAHLHNIKIVIWDEKREQSNLLNCIHMYLGYIENELPEYKYERKKVM
jgi:hypothetical protein